MLKQWLALCGLVVFVLATMTAPAYARDTSMAAATVTADHPCHERQADNSARAPVKTRLHDCDTACHCPVSQGAVADVAAPMIAAPVRYFPARLRPENTAERPSYSGDRLKRPPRLNA